MATASYFIKNILPHFQGDYSPKMEEHIRDYMSRIYSLLQEAEQWKAFFPDGEEIECLKTLLRELKEKNALVIKGHIVEDEYAGKPGIYEIRHYAGRRYLYRVEGDIEIFAPCRAEKIFDWEEGYWETHSCTEEVYEGFTLITKVDAFYRRRYIPKEEVTRYVIR